MVLPILILNVPAGVALGFFVVFVFWFMRYLLEMEKARQGVSATKSGNGFKKPVKHLIWLFILLFYFFLIFSVAFVAGERKSLVQQGLLRDLPGNGVGNGIATSHATGAAFSERKLHLTEFFIGQLTKTVSKIPVRC